MPDFLGFLQPVATQPARFASRFLLANRRFKFITDPTPKRGPSNVQSVTEVFRLRQVVNQNFKSKLNLIFEANLIRFLFQFFVQFCSWFKSLIYHPVAPLSHFLSTFLQKKTFENAIEGFLFASFQHPSATTTTSFRLSQFIHFVKI